MDVAEPRVRHRGFFLHSDTTGEPDTGEHENPEGFIVRVRLTRPALARQVGGGRTLGSSRERLTSGRSRSETSFADVLPQIRSGSVTGSRQRAHSHR